MHMMMIEPQKISTDQSTGLNLLRGNLVGTNTLILTDKKCSFTRTRWGHGWTAVILNKIWGFSGSEAQHESEV